MNNNDLTCSVCGSHNVEVKDAVEWHKVPYSYDVEIKTIIHVCSDCGSEIDVTQDSDRIKALSISQKHSVETIINYLSEHDESSLANIERALSLPQRTLSRWKAGQDPSAAGLTLLRIIRTFPWITDVADEGFEENVARRILLEQAAHEFNTYVMKSYQCDQVGVGMVQSTGESSASKITVFHYAMYYGKENQEPYESITSPEQLFVREVP
jgi:hypothetical protein